MKNKKKIEHSAIEPTDWDDMDVKMVRSGPSFADKNFLKEDPRFTEEAMEKRSQARSLALHERVKKELLEKFGK